jgi:hypothetical protein
MATRYIGIATPAAGVQVQAGRTNIVGASSGGTLAGSQVCQIVFDDSVYGSTNEAKQRLITQVRSILDVMESARTWPIDSAS